MGTVGPRLLFLKTPISPLLENIYIQMNHESGLPTGKKRRARPLTTEIITLPFYSVVEL